MTDSIMQDGKYCYVTGRTDHLDKHHVYGAANRKQSERYGCWVWLTHDVHMAAHQRQTEILTQLRQECQEAFEAIHGHDKFMQVFGKNYL